MIQHREIQPPYITQYREDGDYTPEIDALVDTTEEGTKLNPGKHVYTLTHSGDIGVVTVLQNGNGFVRTYSAGTDHTVTANANQQLRLSSDHPRRILMDTIPNRPDLVAITDVFIHKRDLFRGNRKNPHKNRPDGQRAS